MCYSGFLTLGVWMCGMAMPVAVGSGRLDPSAERLAFNAAAGSAGGRRSSSVASSSAGMSGRAHAGPGRAEQQDKRPRGSQ
jgi:hypothetical protein